MGPDFQLLLGSAQHSLSNSVCSGQLTRVPRTPTSAALGNLVLKRGGFLVQVNDNQMQLAQAIQSPGNSLNTVRGPQGLEDSGQIFFS